jgi:hypothetical protein
MRRSLTAAALLAAFGICGAAAAQSRPEELYPTGITLRGGVAIPIDKSLTNVASALGDIGVEYTLTRPLLSAGDTFLSFDYFWKAFGGNGGGSVSTLMLNQRVYTSEAEFRSYYFFGVGAAFVNVGGNGTALAARLGVGQELGKAVIAEIGGYISDRTGGTRANAVTLSIGYRF